MIFILICFAGLAFVALTLPSALRKRTTPNRDVRDDAPFLIDLKPNRTCWEKDPNFSPLARDRQEVLENWEKCANDVSCPPPIPPVKPTVYFGNETITGGFGPESN